MKTREEVQALKSNWMSDPNWDIEDTEGFEEWYADLRAFRMEKELEWKTKRDALPINRAKFWVSSDDITATAYALIAIHEELVKLNKSIEEYVDRH